VPSDSFDIDAVHRRLRTASGAAVFIGVTILFADGRRMNINERTLLERLSDPNPEGDRRLQVDVSRLKRSVLLHLSRMLNCRHGHAPAQPDYGIPDLNEFMYAFPDSITPMRQAIQASIEKYEPRLKNVRVIWSPDEDDPLNVRFEITARLITEKDDLPVAFSTKASGGSGLAVEES
jgi:type VI secretion system protein